MNMVDLLQKETVADQDEEKAWLCLTLPFSLCKFLDGNGPLFLQYYFLAGAGFVHGMMMDGHGGWMGSQLRLRKPKLPLMHILIYRCGNRRLCRRSPD